MSFRRTKIVASEIFDEADFGLLMKAIIKTLSEKLYNSTSGGKSARTYLFDATIFFAIGAGLEYTMIHWRPNGHNFYDTFKKNQAEKIAEERLHRELEKQLEYFKKAKIE